jgi:hypothetical protein
VLFGYVFFTTRAVNEFRFDCVSFRFVVTKRLTKWIFVLFIKQNCFLFHAKNKTVNEIIFFISLRVFQCKIHEISCFVPFRDNFMFHLLNEMINKTALFHNRFSCLTPLFTTTWSKDNMAPSSIFPSDKNFKYPCLLLFQNATITVRSPGGSRLLVIARTMVPSSETKCGLCGRILCSKRSTQDAGRGHSPLFYSLVGFSF